MNRPLLQTLAIVVTAVTALPSAAGQQTTPPAASSVPEPHMCRFGAAVNVSTFGPPRLMTGIGTSQIRITTRVPAAQQFFNQGLNLLHGFWDTEAYRAFKEAARQDPRAAMAWWGIFTALGQNAQEMAVERREALERAAALAPSASEHEQFYIRAASYLADVSKGRAAYISEMEALIDRHPDDVEAQLLLANTLSTPVSSYAPDGRPRDGKLYGQAILRNLLVTHPQHAAVHHYWIHAVENGPRPEAALESAKILPRLVPGIGHMLHMPGHIYYRLGEYGQARDAFVQSLAHDEAYMVREGMNPINNWNYVHNLDYLVAAAAESGRLAEGLKYARILASLPADAGRLRAQGIGYMLYGGHTAIARLHMRYARWREAKAAIEEARKKITFDDPLLEGYYDGLAIYTGAMAALASDDVAGARAAAAALDALWTPLSQQRAQNAGDWYFRHAIRVLDVHRIELKALIESAQGSHDEAIATLTDAARRERDLGYWEPPHYTRPVLESLGAACARAGRWDEAKAAFEAALERRPRSGHPLAGLARAAARSNRPQEAAAAWRRLLKVWADADPDLPEMIEAARRP